MDLNEKIGTTVSRMVRTKISDNAESKAAGEAVEYSVKFIFDETWTVNELIDRLVSASSPRVTFQNSHRGKTVPTEWKVNKAGYKADVPIEAKIDALSADAKKALYERLKKQLGDLL